MNATPLRSVLYVDDEPDIREIVQIALGLTNTLAVHTAESGEQALTSHVRCCPIWYCWT